MVLDIINFFKAKNYRKENDEKKDKNCLEWSSFAVEGWAPSHNPQQSNPIKRRQQSTPSINWFRSLFGLFVFLDYVVEEELEWMIGKDKSN